MRTMSRIHAFAGRAPVFLESVEEARPASIMHVHLNCISAMHDEVVVEDGGGVDDKDPDND